MIKVVIADDHTLVRQSIRSLLEKSLEVKVLGEASNGQEAVDIVQSLHPDLLILDLSMPGLSGLEAITQICSIQSKTRIVILSMYSDESLVFQALQNGACGYILKQTVTEDLLPAVYAINGGETYISAQITGQVQEEFKFKPQVRKRK
jgi:DNA-binding NarL/FixJ family response regulator